jgi:hypothetical protein
MGLVYKVINLTALSLLVLGDRPGRRDDFYFLVRSDILVLAREGRPTWELFTPLKLDRP